VTPDFGTGFENSRVEGHGNREYWAQGRNWVWILGYVEGLGIEFTAKMYSQKIRFNIRTPHYSTL